MIVSQKIAANFRDEKIITEKSHGEFSRTANYRSKIPTDWNNRHHKNVEKFPQHFILRVILFQ